MTRNCRFIALEKLRYLVERQPNSFLVKPDVELSYLSQKEQTAVAAAMDELAVKPSLSQAVRLKEMKKAGTLTIEAIDKMLSEAKKPPKGEQTGSLRFRKYFPPDYSQKQMDAVIIDLLKEWKARAMS